MKAILESACMAVVGGAADAIIDIALTGSLDPHEWTRRLAMGGVVGFAYWLKGPRGGRDWRQ